MEPTPFPTSWRSRPDRNGGVALPTELGHRVVLSRSVRRRIHRRAWELCRELYYRLSLDMAADLHEGLDPAALAEWRPRI